jgi:hypothetical protein
MATAFDSGIPNIARMYDHLLGGKDNYEIDRAAVRRILQIEPYAADVALANRAFLGRAVRYLAAGQGIRQFLDIGSGLPTGLNIHEVAQGIAPESRIAYVDNDSTVLAHARAKLTSSPEGECSYIDADLRDTKSLIEQAGEALDFTRPVAVLLISILHFIRDEDDPWSVVRDLMSAVPSGSYLVVSHAMSDDMTAGQLKELDDVYKGTVSGGVTQRSLEAVAALFSELDLVEPGLVSISAWRPGAEDKALPERVLFHGGVASKP